MLGSQNKIGNADQPTSQICGLRVGNIPAKVIAVDCKHVVIQQIVPQQVCNLSIVFF